MVTVNPNKAPQGLTPQAVKADARRLSEKIRRITALLWSPQSLANGALKFLIPGHAFTREHVVNVSTNFAVEVGARFNRIHSHSVVQVEHRSMIHLDYAYIRQFFIDNSGGEFANVHLDVRFMRGH